MPAGISAVFGATATSSASAATAPPSWSAGAGEGGASSFDNALNQAQYGSASSSAGAADTRAQPAGRAATKKALPAHSPSRKKASALDIETDKAAKKPAANQPAQPALPEDGEPETGDAGAQGSANTAGKKQAKKPAASDGVATSDTPAAVTVQPKAGPTAPEASKADGTAGPPASAASARKPLAAAADAKNLTSAETGTAAAADNEESAGPTATPVDDASDAGLPSRADARSAKTRLAIQPRQTDFPDANAAESAAATVASPAEPQSAATGGQLSSDVSSDAATVPSVEGAATPAKRDLTKLLGDPVLQSLNPPGTPPGHAAIDAAAGSPADASSAPASATAQFAETNHANIVSGIQGRLLPGGGSMQIRLDPPELGAMQVRVEMRDGIMTASFETSSDQATKLLSHSLGDLKTALEAQGVNVERLQVSQSPKQQQPSSSSSDQGQQDGSQPRQDAAAQQEQQRREMMQRMWRRLMNGQDPLDLVA